jgi:DNA invertase Pin-like site-specific DNA recombinase
MGKMNNKLNLKQDKSELVERPEQYAAIYARRSMKHDKNSPEAQIQECLDIAKEHNLIVYDNYSDIGLSGRTVAPLYRKGFGRLFNDAKAGHFKNIIIWKHDRLSRNSEDFYKTKNLLESMGVRLIFGDTLGLEKSQPIYKDFISNLLIMIAELEPINTLNKANAGRDYLRKNGIINLSGGLFGYDMVIKFDELKRLMNMDIITGLKVKTYYKTNNLQAAFIRFFFNCYLSYDSSDKNARVNSIKTLVADLEEKLKPCETIDSLKSMLNDIHSENEAFQELIASIEHEIPHVSEDASNEDKSKTFNAFIIELEKCFKFGTSFGAIERTIRNFHYTRWHLKDAKMRSALFKYNNARDRIEVDENLLTEVKNADEIIDFKVWKKAASHAVYYTTHGESLMSDYDALSSNEVEEPFLFKGNLKCGSCSKKLKEFENDIFSCPIGCTKIKRLPLLEIITREVLDKVFSKSMEDTATLFIDKVKKEVEAHKANISSSCQKLKLLQNEIDGLIKNYLSEGTTEIAEKIKDKTKEIKTIKETMASEKGLIDGLNGVYSSISDKKENSLKILKQYIFDKLKADAEALHFFIDSILNDKIIKEVLINNHDGKEECIFTFKA